MRQYKQSLTKTERRLLKRVILAAIAASVLWIILAPDWGLLHYHRMQTRIEALQQENRELAERNRELREDIERLKNDDAYLEELARQKYGMLKENETVYEVK